MCILISISSMIHIKQLLFIIDICIPTGKKWCYLGELKMSKIVSEHFLVKIFSLRSFTFSMNNIFDFNSVWKSRSEPLKQFKNLYVWSFSKKYLSRRDREAPLFVGKLHRCLLMIVSGLGWSWEQPRSPLPVAGTPGIESSPADSQDAV